MALNKNEWHGLFIKHQSIRKERIVRSQKYTNTLLNYIV